ncbi:MAG: MaoC/PaaZ C-terminal domain-containing protein [Chloroflexota bacterium]
MSLYWEDIREGDEVTPLSAIASTRTLVKFAGATGDFNPLHYEGTFAARQGVDRPIVHGQLKRAWLVHMLTDWIGEAGTLRKFSCQFRAVDYPRLMESNLEAAEGETWWCRGKVTRKYQEGSEHLVDCDVRVENGSGQPTTIGHATAALPVRG